MNPKLSAGISVVKSSDDILEFFKTNTRKQVYIKVRDDVIMNIVLELDGTKTLNEISKKYGVSIFELERLIAFLSKKGIVDNIIDKKKFKNYEKFRRVINFISDYSTSHDDMLDMWKNITGSTVMIVGLGAVGSWVACNLVQSGIEKLIIIDPDKVELSNLHRQFSFTYNDVGRLKIDVLEHRLKMYNSDVEIIKCGDFLDSELLNNFNDFKIDLIINCADKPNVDTTSVWVGEYSMRRDIPHIIGGGYNMHLSLIGQTVLPGKTACVNCFKKKLEEENHIDSTKVKKLMVKNRKVGSFGPMCSIIASMIGMEAIKVLSKKIVPSNINRRGEFDIYKMDIKYKDYERREDCEWCGTKGKYHSD